MRYFQSGPTGQGKSHLRVEWTNQHGCGKNTADDPIKVNCQMVLQYMCQPDDANLAPADKIRDGVQQGANKYKKPAWGEKTLDKALKRLKANNPKQGMHEPPQWRDKCEMRPRNGGLFTADQKLKDFATSTRQNANAGRNGHECPEERDYYPYWHPTDWKDIAVLLENQNRCPDMIKDSFSGWTTYNECQENFPKDGKPSPYSKANNKADCETKQKGKWLTYYNFLEKLEKDDKTRATSAEECFQLAAKKGIPKTEVKYALALYGLEEECLVRLPKPECKVAAYTRVNHNGNTGDLTTPHYDWILPRFPSGRTQRCVFRIRYNISTDDYDPANTDASSNGNAETIAANPNVNVGLPDGQTLQLAINTAQFGRTFQDRSHVFLLKPRPAEIGDDGDIYNVNARGKRGNLVQTYPATEYDFVPTELSVTTKDMIHFQWTGSNTHNNKNPAGDGQSGTNGGGADGTDRHNLLSLKTRRNNFFLPIENKASMVQHMKAVWTPEGSAGDLNGNDIGLRLASGGFYKSVDDFKKAKTKMDNNMNNAAASFEGIVVKITDKGNYPYGSSRNNNFSNRDQKAEINVK